MSTPTVSVITPWRGCPELIPSYEQTVQGTEVIIIDNASQQDHARAIQAMCARLGAIYIRNEENRYFAAANNQARPFVTGDILLFLNNDVFGQPGWLDLIRRDILPNALMAPSRGMKMVDGQSLVYLEGWCVAGYAEAWEKVNWWDEDTFSLPYWDDNWLCFQAARQGIRLIKTAWPIQHLGGMTTRQTPEAQEAVTTNERVFKQRVREYWAGVRA